MREPYFRDDRVSVFHGDCKEVLAELAPESVHAVITDAPYELNFMGKTWDASGIAYDAAMWAECLRVLKPGGHLLAFGGTRTYHRMTSAIEDAGFEIRDSIHWIYGSGFPKSLDVSKAIDKAAGATREVVGPGRWNHVKGSNEVQADVLIRPGGKHDETAPATPEAAAWSGWGTALKPAHEPIVVARKPLVGTVAGNVLAHGTGALNIDGCRVPGTAMGWSSPRGGIWTTDSEATGTLEPREGRWPSNIVLDEAAAAELDAQSGVSKSGTAVQRNGGGQRIFNTGAGLTRPDETYGDTGGASRFFPVFRYEAKAPTVERPRVDGAAHATVKPLDLMRWLVRLVTPPGGTVLDPFAGSGTTAEACVVEGFHCIAVELDAGHLPLIKARLGKPIQPVLFGDEAAS